MNYTYKLYDLKLKKLNVEKDIFLVCTHVLQIILLYRSLPLLSASMSQYMGFAILIRKRNKKLFRHGAVNIFII